MNLWNKNQEKLFFIESLKDAKVNQLFYCGGDKYFAYWPRGYRGVKSTLQSRNSLIGNYTEIWVQNLLKSVINDKNLYIVNQARIPALGINSSSPADVVIATVNKKILKPSEVKIIFEVKMSIVWNWQYDVKTKEIFEIGDFRTHQGKPSFTRSDSILKAIGKCIDIRVSNFKSSKIPIIVLGNAPLSNGFCKKADYLKSAGIIQGFWSLNPFPLNHGNTRKTTPKRGYLRLDSSAEMKMHLNILFDHDLNFFSGMEDLESLGHYVEIANEQNGYEDKGLKFLNLLKRS
ncbi:MAG: hypothetical protein UHW99_03750 [Methanobrevibacter sp.]|nr:hypothetical protein [Methanobrevibacter sp.]